MTTAADRKEPVERDPDYPPIADDDATIERALRDVSVPTLMMAMVHLTGDMSWVRGEIRPGPPGLNGIQGDLSDADQATVRAAALESIRDYRDRGSTLPAPPSAEDVLEMMAVLVGQPVADAHAQMIFEDLLQRRHDPGGPELVSSAEDRAALHVVVIGCGESGLLAGIRLSRAGIPFTILEKNAGVGGTWFENTYPGARVDIANHFYSYSFEPRPWSHFYAQQPELHAYLEEVMDQHGIEPNVRFGCEVQSAAWDDDRATWTVAYTHADGAVATLDANAVICAVGQLNRPTIPELPGAEDFAGPSFHSARWEHDVDVDGKDVALIGAGASGFQIAPAIADRVRSLTVYQRTAQWIAPNPLYYQPVGDGVAWALEHLPYYDRWYRTLVAFAVTDGAIAATRIDPDWDGGNESVSEMNMLSREFFLAAYREHVPDPELLAKLTPDYPCLGKRTLQDDGTWFRTLQREDVELVREPIEAITASGVRTADGIERPTDVIVYATGFVVPRMIYPLEIVGRAGVKLDDEWGESPAAYLGITVPRFPNLFLMYGPKTNAVNGTSLFFQSECWMRYILGCLDRLAATGARAMEPRQDVHDDYDRRTNEELAQMVWAHPSIKHSYYKNSKGELHTVQPWRIVDYWRWTSAPDPDDYVFT
jgi:4-hydroxyacetophenone monooxygenase